VRNRLRSATGRTRRTGNDLPQCRLRELLGHLHGLGFGVNLDRGALYFADVTGWRRDLFRLISPTLVFEVLDAGSTTIRRCSIQGRIGHEYDHISMTPGQCLIGNFDYAPKPPEDVGISASLCPLTCLASRSLTAE